MGLLLKARTATISEATLQLRMGQKKENPIEMEGSMLPAEWFPQSGVILTWPHHATDWLPYLKEVTDFYVKLAFCISATERLLIVIPETETVRTLLREQLPHEALKNISFCTCPTNDTWTRDHGPISVREEGKWMLKDFRF
ncbi:MAG: agmatine deiminase family protein, partial [Bacteroidaceae bacterium]